jgi:anaerobic selenocysteine-containing dehydrogenase
LRDDLFTVVHEQFLTDTTDYADIVLPATTFFEHGDLQKAYGHYYLQTSQKSIEPLGECRSNVDTFRALAKRMGFSDACFDDTDEQMMDDALKSDHPWLKGITRETLNREKHIRLKFDGEGKPFLPFAEGNFPTPSGKAEFYSESLRAKGLDPVVSFTPPIESRHRDVARKYPLEILTRKFVRKTSSLSHNLMQPVEVRLASYLLSICPDESDAASLADAANMIGTSYRHLNRVVQQLCAEGLIERDKGRIRIKDRERLLALGEQNIYE